MKNNMVRLVNCCINMPTYVIVLLYQFGSAICIVFFETRSAKGVKSRLAVRYARKLEIRVTPVEFPFIFTITKNNDLDKNTYDPLSLLVANRLGILSPISQPRSKREVRTHRMSD